MHDVFISYKSEERHIAEAIYQFLQSENMRCWMDHYSIVPGADWAAFINDAIKSTKIFLFVQPCPALPKPC